MRIVLTGGPSAGKTTIAETLARAFCLNLIPESASILFRGGFPRDPQVNAVKCQQIAIYHVQNQMEKMKDLDKSMSSICDRGTLDGLAYWPGAEEEFFHSINSCRTIELGRYDWVLHLDTADAITYQNNPIRRESFAQAKILNEQVKEAWSGHPNRVILTNNRNFSHKITLAIGAVQMMLNGESKFEIERFLLK